ncbi:MAG: hypothetical protein V3U80_02775 [Flavobacteriaceae bacterium]
MNEQKEEKTLLDYEDEINVRIAVVKLGTEGLAVKPDTGQLEKQMFFGLANAFDELEGVVVEYMDKVRDENKSLKSEQTTLKSQNEKMPLDYKEPTYIMDDGTVYVELEVMREFTDFAIRSMGNKDIIDFETFLMNRDKKINSRATG